MKSKVDAMIIFSIKYGEPKRLRHAIAAKLIDFGVWVGGASHKLTMKSARNFEFEVENILKAYGISPYEPNIHTKNDKGEGWRSMLPQDISDAVYKFYAAPITPEHKQSGKEKENGNV